MSSNVTSTQTAVVEDEIDLRELFGVIWQGKWIIIASTFIFALMSVIYALSLPNIYKSDALLAPANSEGSSGGLAALASQFGGLASFTGINIGGQGSADKTQLAIEVLKSRQFIGDFIEKYQILPELIAVDKWNMANNKIIYDPEIYNSELKVWINNDSKGNSNTPSHQTAYKALMRLININVQKDTGFMILSVSHKSPFIAKQWLDWLIADINWVMKERDVAEAIRSTEFLKKQIELTNVADIRAMLYKLVEEQAKTIMFAEVRDEYVFKTLDPALVPEEKATPKRALICLLGTFLGGITAVMFVLVRYFFSKN